MKMNMGHTFLALLVLFVWVAVGTSQQATGQGQGAPMKVEGTITNLSLTAAPGPPFMTVKTAEGVEYTVHFGPLQMLKNQGFSPKVGDAVTVNGFACPAGNSQMIHSNEITLAGKTYATPMPQQQMMRMQPGMGSMSNMPCEPGNCPMQEGGANCPMPQGMHHEMHHPEMHHSTHHR